MLRGSMRNDCKRARQHNAFGFGAQNGAAYEAMRPTARIVPLVMACWFLGVIVLLAAFPPRAMAQAADPTCAKLKQDISDRQQVLVRAARDLSKWEEYHRQMKEYIKNYKEEYKDDLNGTAVNPFSSDRSEFLDELQQLVDKMEKATAVIQDLTKYMDYIKRQNALLLTKLADCHAKKPTDTTTVSTKSDPCSVSVADAEKRIQAHVDFIRVQEDAMAAKYYSEGAVKTLRASFESYGVKDAMKYADSWGTGGIGLTWSDTAKAFYTFHSDTLIASSERIALQGCAKKSDLDYLDAGMQRWKDAEPTLAKLFDDLVAAYSSEATLSDRKDAYLKAYYEELDRLSALKPYPSDQIDALNTKMTAKTKEYDERDQQLVKEQDTIKDRIRTWSGYEFLHKVPVKTSK